MFRQLVLPLAVLLGLSSTGQSADAPKPLTRIGFGSCAQQDNPMPIWKRVVDAKPEVFLFIGDIIYADVGEDKIDARTKLSDDQFIAKMQAKYRKLANDPGYKKLSETCPILGTWDDHDYGLNDAGVEYPRKEITQRLLLDFLGVPRDAPRRQQKGVYDAQILGPEGQRVQIILLDTRYFRSPLKKRAPTRKDEGPYAPNDDPSATMLGEAQWKWLEDQLKKPAEVRILASSIQVVSEDHNWEKWMNLPHERARLYKLLQDTRANGVIVISGDRHLAELSLQTDAISYPLYDLTSSGINQASKSWRPLEVNRHRVATMPYGDNFGLITIDWNARDARGERDPRLSLQIRDVEGDVVINHKVPLSKLRPTARKPVSSSRVKLTSGEWLTPETIKKHLDQTVTIEMTVQASGGGIARAFLNSEKDFRQPENFTVVLTREVVSALKKERQLEPRDLVGKTIKVTGKLVLFREKAEIIVEELKQLDSVPR